MGIKEDWCYGCKHCVSDPEKIDRECPIDYMVLAEYHDHVIWCSKFKNLEFADNNHWTVQRVSCDGWSDE